MGLNIGGMIIPTSGAEAGANIHNNFIPAISALPAPVQNAMTLSSPLAHAIAGFIHGVATGSAAQAAADPAATKGKTAAPAAPKSNSNAGQTVTLGNGLKVTLPSAAFLKANPATPWNPTGTIGYGSANPDGPPAASASGGKQTASSNAASGNPQIQVVQPWAAARALLGSGMSFNQINSVADMLARVAPPMMPHDQAIAQYVNQVNQSADADQNAAAATNNGPAMRAATDRRAVGLHDIVQMSPMYPYDYNTPPGQQ